MRDTGALLGLADVGVGRGFVFANEAATARLFGVGDTGEAKICGVGSRQHHSIEQTGVACGGPGVGKGKGEGEGERRRLLTSVGNALSLHKAGVDADGRGDADDGNEGSQSELHLEKGVRLYV